MSHPPSDRFSRITMFLAGGVSVGICVALFSGDWACAAIGDGLAASLLTPIADWLGPRLFGRVGSGRRSSLAWRRSSQMTLLAVIAVGFAGWSWVSFRLDQPRLFEAAFGVRPPAGVTRLRVERHYAGGPGDMVCLMRFHADGSTINRLASYRPLTKGSEELETYRKGQIDWAGFLRVEFLLAIPFKPEWAQLPLIERPEVYHEFGASAGPLQTIRLLWNPETGEAYLLYSLG